MNEGASKNLHKLLEELVTKQEVEGVLLELDVLEKEGFRTFKSDESTKDAKNLKRNTSLLRLLTDSDEEKDRDGLQKIKEEITKFFADYEFFRLTVAFEPEREFLKKIKAKIYDNCGISPIFDVELDPVIVGGALVDFKGYHFDFSLKKRLEEYFVTKRDAILSKL